MVDSLKIEVALDGSEQVKRDFYEMGVAGRQAFLGLAEAAAKFSAAFAVGVGVAVVAATKKLSDFANAAEETEKALTQLQKVSGQSFNNLSALANVFAQGGTSLKQFASDFGKLSEKIAAAGEEAAKKQAISQQLEDIGKGLKATALPAITLKERVDELLDTLSRVPPEERWSRLADIFKNLGDTVERARIGKAIGLSPEEIATLSQGSEAVKRLQAEAERLGLTLTSSNQRALQEMAQGWNQFSALLDALFQKIGAAAAPAFAAILNSFKSVMQGIAEDFQNLQLDQAIANLGNRLTPAFEALGQVLLPIVAALGTALGNAIVNAIAASVAEGIQNIKNKWFGPPAPGSPGFVGPVQPSAGSFAGGGLLGGRGTGTSDSNLAWVSRGEYITPAAVVAQPGMLALLEALRRSGGNLAGVLEGMGRFALGGMVPRAMPAFASGGLVGSQRSMVPITLNLSNGMSAAGMAEETLVNVLRSAAAKGQVRSGGRKPSRYG